MSASAVRAPAVSAAASSGAGATATPLRLVLASNNAKKLAELRALLAGLPLAVVAQGELGIPEAEEPHHTFVENALAKARAAALACGGAAIADDSGLCVAALGGAPGVVSAHYAGLLHALPGEAREALRRRQDAANNSALLAALAALPAPPHAAATLPAQAQSQAQPQRQLQRQCHFISTLVAVRHAHDPEPLVAVGRWPGWLLSSPRGEQGFGYDPLMWIDELGATVAELSPELKNQHSHRARAAAQLRAQLAETWLRGLNPEAAQA